MLVLGVPVFALAGRADAAYGLGLVAATALAVRWARAPGAFDLAFVAVVGADAWLTALGAFEHFNHHDAAGHLLAALAVTPVLYFFGCRAGLLASRGPADGRAPLTATACAAAALTVTLGAMWEVVEALSDALLHTNMSLSRADTWGDLAADATGGVLGAMLLIAGLRQGLNYDRAGPGAPPRGPGGSSRPREGG